MGVVNVTPDSFSDGGRFLDRTAALRHARSLIDEGADILDIGGESTRPGAEPVGVDEEADRVVPLIAALRAESDVAISVDTMKPAVAQAAVRAGATIWNDITGLGFAPESLDVAAALGCTVVLMHMQGEPRTMQADPRYGDVVAEVETWLADRARAATSAGIRPDRVWLDPGIGFGKTLAHNLDLLNNLQRLTGLGYPLLMGVSRKGFIRGIDPAAASADARLGGSLAAALWSAAQGAAVVRVHDVRETVQALKVWDAIAAREASS